MIELIVSTDRLGLVVMGERLIKATKRFPFALKARGMYETQGLINVVLNEDEPPERGIGPVPFVFASPRSAAWFFAHYPNGYTRTEEIRQWQAVIPLDSITEEGFLVRLDNPVVYTGYVRDPRQVPGHRDTGWKPWRPVVESNNLAGVAAVEAGAFWLTITEGLGQIGTARRVP